MRLKYLPLLAAAALCIGMLCVAPAQAVSESLHRQMLAECPEFAQAEQHMADMLTKLQQAAPPALWAHYSAEQSAWLDYQRDEQLIDVLALFDKDLFAGPGQVLQNDRPSVALSCALLTFERAKALNMLRAQVADPATPLTMPGRISLRREASVTWYMFTPNAWCTAFTLCTDKDLDKLSPAMRAWLEECALGKHAEESIRLTGCLSGPASYVPDAQLAVAPLGEGMGWRELDNWDDFDM